VCVCCISGFSAEHQECNEINKHVYQSLTSFVSVTYHDTVWIVTCVAIFVTCSTKLNVSCGLLWLFFLKKVDLLFFCVKQISFRIVLWIPYVQSRKFVHNCRFMPINFLIGKCSKKLEILTQVNCIATRTPFI